MSNSGGSDTAGLQSEVRRLETEVQIAKARLGEARRRLAKVGDPITDHVVCDLNGNSVRLSVLFGKKPELFVVHNMGRACVYCTMWGDGLNGVWRHMADRAGFVLTTPDEPGDMRAFAQSRGWTFPIVCVGGTRFASELGFEPEPGRLSAGISALALRSDGQGNGVRIVRTGSARFGPGDDFSPAWAAFDLLADGPGRWTPKYDYPLW